MALLCVPLTDMTINPDYRLDFDMDDIRIQKRQDGVWHDLAPISETAAMVWEGVERGLDRDAIVRAIVNEFDGADEATVAADMDALLAQLTALGIAEA